MKNLKTAAATAMLSALYFVLSALLKIVIVGHITIDLGYTALMVSAAFLGAVPAMFVGGIGALLESAMLSGSGISIGWILMNMIIGVITGAAVHPHFRTDKKKFLITSFIFVPVSVFLGVIVKTVLDCLIRGYAFAVKIPSSLTAFLLDAAVMLAIGLPVCLALRNKIKA